MEKYTSIATFILALLGAPTTLLLARAFLRRGKQKADFERSWRDELRGDIKNLKEDLEKAAIHCEHLENKIDELKAENTRLNLAIALAVQKVAQMKAITYIEAEDFIFDGKFLELTDERRGKRED